MFTSLVLFAILAIIVISTSILTPINLATGTPTIFAGIKNLSSNTGDSFWPLIDVSGNFVYVVWTDQTNFKGPGDILFKRSTDGGNSFGATINLSNDVSGSGNVKIAKSGSNVYVIWQDFSSDDIFFRRSTNNGATFESTVNLSMDTHPSSSPEIAASESNVYVVWGDIYQIGGLGCPCDETQLFFRASNNNGISFGSVKTIFGAANITIPPIEDITPQIAAVGSNVYIAGHYGHDDVTEIFFMRSINNGISFSTPVSINNNHEASIIEGLSADVNKVYVLWSDFSLAPLQDREVFIRRSPDNGANFKDSINLSNNVGNSAQAVMKVIGSNVYVVWRDTSVNAFPPSDIFFKKSMNGGESFGSKKNISNNPGDSSNPQISRAGTDIRIVWQDDTSGPQDDVLFRDSGDNGITFGNIQNLSNNPGRSSDPMIVSYGNSTYVVWNDNSSGNYEILFRKGTG